MNIFGVELRKMKKRILEVYRKWSTTYDSDAGLNPAVVVSKGLVIPTLNARKKDTILDIGCGTGRFTIPLAKRCKKIIGIDFSNEMLKIAREKSKGIKNIEFKKVDVASRLPFKNNSFDKVLCILVVSHLKDLDSFFKEVHRVLKKNGIFVYDEFISNIKRPFKLRYHDYIAEFQRKGKKVFISRPIHEYLELIEKYNFKILKFVPLKITEKAKHTLTKRSFEVNKGRYLSLIFKLKK